MTSWKEPGSGVRQNPALLRANCVTGQWTSTMLPSALLNNGILAYATQVRVLSSLYGRGCKMRTGRDTCPINILFFLFVFK